MFLFAIIESVVVVTFFFCTVPTKAQTGNNENLIAHNDEEPFANLLHSIVNVNVKRLDTMKKLTELDDLNMVTNYLRNGKNDDVETKDSEQLREDGLLAVLIFDNRRGLRFSEKVEPYLTLLQTKETNTRVRADKNVTLEEDTSEEFEDEIPFNELNSTNCTINFEQKAILRKSWRNSCDKRAAKVCRKACVGAYKSVCSMFKCSRKMKKRFKKECKRSCNYKFNKTARSDSSDSD